MRKYIVRGGTPLYGSTGVQGAKNSALPILAASVLSGGRCVIRNCPALSDVEATLAILRHVGCETLREGGAVVVDSARAEGSEIPEPLMREMRSSVIFLGALLAKTGYARLSAPGGCEIGLRPIDLHLDAMRRLGAAVKDDAGVIECRAPDGLKGANITLSFPSVGATENIMIAAATAKGETLVVNAAREPEISDLADYLNGMGAKISGAGEGTVRIRGVSGLHPAEHTVIPDRIAAATLLAAAAATGGEVTVNRVIPAHLEPVLAAFAEAGCDTRIRGDAIRLTAPARLKAVSTVRTMPYPGFPTDFQAPFTAVLTKADGASVVIETIFESRFKYIGELVRFGAKIRRDGRMAVIEGVPRLYPAGVVTPDLRGGAALVLAALSAEGESEIRDVRHIERGYEDICGAVRALHGNMEAVSAAP